jgi:hypothetical protein
VVNEALHKQKKQVRFSSTCQNRCVCVVYEESDAVPVSPQEAAELLWIQQHWHEIDPTASPTHQPTAEEVQSISLVFSCLWAFCIMPGPRQAQEMVEKADILKSVLEARKEVKKKWKGAKQQRQKVLDHAAKVAAKVERRVRRKCARILAERIRAVETEEDPGAAVRFPALAAPSRPTIGKGSSKRQLVGGAGGTTPLPHVKR